MKTAIYITRNKVWAGDSAYDWDGINMDEVWMRIKREKKINEARIILGNDVSFVTSMRLEETMVNRMSALRMAKSWLPFEIDDDCFDWKEVEIALGEKWLQLIAIQKEFLTSLSAAVKKNGVRVDMVTAIGVLLADKTTEREVPVVVKWTGKEDLLVVAVKGLVDIVTSDVSEDDLMVYAKQKWGLAVNPEQLSFSEAETDLTKEVYAERAKGEDRLVLNLPILKEIVLTGDASMGAEKGSLETTEEPRPEKKKSRLGLYLLILLVVLSVCAGILWKIGKLPFLPGESREKVDRTEEVVSPTPTASPTEEPKPDLSLFSVQVLNGSGVSGEAAKVKEVLLGMGFTSVDVGNTTTTNESLIRTKETVPSSVGNLVIKSIKDYTLMNSDVLTSDGEYDLIIVLGGNY
ncbi:MAG TPA: LytR C-terminal domain-containing protein [Candidatus Woesebacteria bacterium]|nr:LytR C-terminal domain-containing protein [Candidatus Woesebacteria bacterium]